MKRINISPNASRIINIAVIALFIIALSLLFFLSPRTMDDYWFILQLRPWFESQNILPPVEGGNIFHTEGLWEGIRQVWLDHYYTDNIRIGNLVAPFVLALPSPVARTVSVLLLLYAVLSIFKLAKVDIKTSPLVPVGVVSLMFFLPWAELLCLIDYQINYVWSSAFALWFLRNSAFGGQGNNKFGSWRLLFIFIVSVLFGAWHEGFSAPVFGAMVIMTILYHEWREPRFIIAEAGMLTGLLCLTLSPGMKERMNGAMSETLSFGTLDLSHLVGYIETGILLAACLVLLILTCRKYLFATLKKDTLSLFLLLTSLISLAIVIHTNIPGRGGWWCRISSIILLLHLSAKYFLASWATYNACRHKILIGILLLAGFIRFGAADYYACVFKHELDRYFEAYYRNPTSPVFGKVYEPKHISPLALYTPFQRFPNTNLDYVSLYTRKLDARMPGLSQVIPENLRNVTSYSGRSISHDLGIRIKDGYLFMPVQGPVPTIIALNADYGFGTHRKQARIYGFRSEADGKDYAYIDIYSNWLENYAGNIRNITGPLEVVLDQTANDRQKQIRFY